MSMKRDVDSEIQFKPLSEGLGLNHFADGLPYTPMQSRRKHLVQFQFPPPRAPQKSQVKSEMSVEPSPSVNPPSSQISGEEIQYAGFFKRVTAFAIDLAIASSIFVLVVWAGLKINGFEFSQQTRNFLALNIFGPLLLLYLVVYLGYFLVQETTWRCTIGKAFLGLRIRSGSGMATLGRAACFPISALPLGIGLLWYFFDSKNRCWHDLISNCEVVVK